MIKRVIVLFILILISIHSQEQTLSASNRLALFALSPSDTTFLRLPEISDQQPKRYFMGSHSHNKIVKYNPLTYVFGSLMYFYQNAVSPEFSTGGCLYTPSCSDFSKQCIERFGLVKGIALSADRFTRCTNTATREIRYFAVDEKTRRYINPPEQYKFSHR